MGFDIGSLVGKSVETEVDYAGDKVVVWYDPNVVTRDRMMKAQEGDEQFLDLFVDLVIDWDVTEDGKKVPITPVALSPLPVSFLRVIFVHIMRESASGEMGKVSSGPSRRRVPRDRQSPSGTATSKRRATSGSPRGNS